MEDREELVFNLQTEAQQQEKKKKEKCTRAQKIFFFWNIEPVLNFINNKFF